LSETVNNDDDFSLENKQKENEILSQQKLETGPTT